MLVKSLSKGDVLVMKKSNCAGFLEYKCWDCSWVKCNHVMMVKENDKDENKARREQNLAKERKIKGTVLRREIQR